MNAATAPRPRGEHRLLVVDAASGREELHASSALSSQLRRGDLLVVNDAATLPASLAARDATGAALEVRLVGALSPEGGSVRFTAALLGEGDHCTRTEDRPAPPFVKHGDVLRIGEQLVAEVLGVSSFSSRLVDLELAVVLDDRSHRDRSADHVWSALYRAGIPVQYAHVPRPLTLWDVTNAWAGRPWAVEMPSAGRALSIGTLLALRARGVEVVAVTHAAGLSSTGDARIDERLPLPERYEVSATTSRAVLRARANGGRVVAVGTSVVRALESAARGGLLTASSGTTDLVLGASSTLAVVDGLITGVHESETSHFALLGAFADRATLERALHTSEREGLLGHELGDAWLVWAARRHATSATFAA